MNKNWFFAENTSPSNEMADKLIDSKFGVDRLSSFVREIIQNSLDAHNDNNNEPVKVTFSSKELSLDKIPGGSRLKEIIEKCCNAQALNHQTRDMYKKGLDVLNSNKIPCLKISDENTQGVEPGLDKAWGAFVYDEGVSRKSRPGAAGSHGVGKKAPFIISGVHTVFYSTKYENTHLFEGKTSLVNWSENNIDYDYKGWYGNINPDTTDRRKRVLPIEYTDSIPDIDDFFLRKDKNGTDVIIVDSGSIINLKDAQAKIIIAILENFFVAIIDKKLECDIFGQIINNVNIDDVLSKYYSSKHVRFEKSGESNHIYDGNLNDYYKVIKEKNPSTIIDMIVDGTNYGFAEIYFDLNNEKNKKYYCIVREHGMKIRDYKINSDQPFTAVVILKNHPNSNLNQSERLNERLASRENAAHDDFIINDDQVPCDPITEKIIKYMYEEIERYLLKMTELKVDSQSFLDSLSDMLYIPGYTSKGSAKKNTPKVKKKRKKLLEQGKGTEDSNGKDGTSAGDGEGKGSGGRGTKKKVRIDGQTNAYLYTNFEQDPMFIHTAETYTVTFIPNTNGNAILNISAISVDGGECLIANMVDCAYQNGKQLKVTGNYIRDVKIRKGIPTSVKIKLQPGLDYALDCGVLLEVKNEN